MGLGATPVWDTRSGGHLQRTTTDDRERPAAALGAGGPGGGVDRPGRCSRRAGQRGAIVGRCSTCSTPGVEQDEVVEHDLGQRMPFAGFSILPPYCMEPARDIDVAAFGDILCAA